MPEQRDHEGQEASNKAFYRGLDAHYDDWAITVLFYVAVHTVHAFLADQGTLTAEQRHPSSHDDVEIALREAGKSTAASSYHMLRDASRQVRYECRRFPDRIPNYANLALCDLEKQLQ
jgi:hypothetical protein